MVKKRILLVSPMPPAIGGISVSTARLRDRLLEDGYEVDTYNLQIRTKTFLHPFWQLANMMFLPLYILFNKRYDIIHLHISGYWRRVFLKITHCFFKGSKIVVTIHGDVANYLNKPCSKFVMSVGDRIICVRPENRKLLPVRLQARSVEIPAFIMPSEQSIDKETLPDNVRSFLSGVDAANLPLIVFNGSVVLNESFYDLYGFDEVVRMTKDLEKDNLKAAVLIIVNDMIFDERKNAFVKKIEERLVSSDNVMLCKLQQFSLLPILKRKNTIYIRPTKTDGDSLSVREALALGVPVVASDAAPRPEGTFLYKLSEGYGAFYKVVSTVLMSEKTETRSHVIYGDYYDKIITVYKSLFG